MPRARYQQQESARKRWRGDNPARGGRRRPIAYRVIQTPSLVADVHYVEGTDSKSLQRAYRRAKRQADNVNGVVKAMYES